jgi:hypothetical protein
MTQRKRASDTGLALVDNDEIQLRLPKIHESGHQDPVPEPRGAGMAVDVEIGEAGFARYVGMILREWDRRDGRDSVK